MSRSRILLIIVALVCSSATMTGCNPDVFSMGEQHVIRCYVMTGHHSIDQGHDVATLHDGAAMSMSSFGTTEYVFRMNTKLLLGEGFRVYLRPIGADRIIRDSGVTVSITTHGVSVDSGQSEVLTRKDVTLKTNTQLPVFLFSDAHYTELIYGCDTLYRGVSRKVETDDIVVQSLAGSEVQIIQPEWELLPELR